MHHVLVLLVLDGLVRFEAPGERQDEQHHEHKPVDPRILLPPHIIDRLDGTSKANERRDPDHGDIEPGEVDGASGHHHVDVQRRHILEDLHVPQLRVCLLDGRHRLASEREHIDDAHEDAEGAAAASPLLCLHVLRLGLDAVEHHQAPVLLVRNFGAAEPSAPAAHLLAARLHPPIENLVLDCLGWRGEQVDPAQIARGDGLLQVAVGNHCKAAFLEHRVQHGAPLALNGVKLRAGELILGVLHAAMVGVEVHVRLQPFLE
mmetsp:Transcript_5032/g.12680  ORF Transcript_5032/g.12680 Transcript_5032/m.12680 type:complete len:261 (-) Transcript_5032:313-1095(-)